VRTRNLAAIEPRASRLFKMAGDGSWEIGVLDHGIGMDQKAQRQYSLGSQRA
jgi:hypothetical protein